jgi:rod shape-determining protein MreC
MNQRPFGTWPDRIALGLVLFAFVLLLLPRDLRLRSARPFQLVLLAPLRAAAALNVNFAALRAENNRLSQLAAELAVENARLQTLCSPDTATPSARFPMVRGRVIARDLTSFERYLVISQGTRGGARAGAPVITAAGLVGKVIACGPDQSLVQTILATESRVSVMSRRSRTAGLARPEAGARLELDYVPRSADFAIGDTVVTAGLGGVFPAGIPVGTVVSLPERASTMFRPVTTKPFINMATVEYVFILSMPENPAGQTGDWLGNTSPPQVTLPDQP